MPMANNHFEDTSTVAFLDLKNNNIPDEPGVYIFRDSGKKVLYVGKAKSLKKRVIHYLKRPLPPKTESLVNKIHSVQFLVTRTEEDALVLEAQLIKKFRPPYNAVLRDDKNYPALRIDLTVPYPRLEVVRKIKNDKAQYFGPYTSAGRLKEAIRFLRKAFPLRSCKSKNPPIRSRPCINYDMGLCLAPCCNLIDKESYKKTAENLVKFLGGGVSGLKGKLFKEMEEASRNLEFEKAAIIRDRIKAIDSIIANQHVMIPKPLNQDFVGIYSNDQGNLYVSIMFVRYGVITGQRVFNLSEAEGEIPEIVGSFMRQYYGSTNFLPDEIVTSVNIADRALMVKWLLSLKGKRVKIVSNPRGFRKELAIMANNNAREHAVNMQASRKSSIISMEKLGNFVGLGYPPHYVGCIDISTMQGRFSTGVLVVFVDGEPAPDLYRVYKIASPIAESGDTLMVAYTIEQLKREESDLLNSLDILIIDGGKGQLNAALKTLGQTSVAIVAIAKERTGDFKSRRLLLEKLYIPGRKQPISLYNEPEVLKFIQRIRDEAHRFAINNYRKLHRKSLKDSILDSIPGVGPKRKRALLSHFKDIYALKNADLEDIMAVPGIPARVAKRIHDFFNSFGR